jgi:hypothetical protein
MAVTDMHATVEELLEAVFSVLSVPKPYNEQLRLQESLEKAVRRVGGWCEMVVSPGAEEYLLLENIIGSAVKTVTDNTSLCDCDL